MFPPELIIGAGVLAAVGAYVFFGGDIRSTLHIDKLHAGSLIPTTGLANLGQTCFFNAVLQAMASCHSFSRWIDPGISDNAAVRCANKDLLTPLHQIISELRGSETHKGVTNSRILWRLLDEIRKQGWVVENGEQHDAHELFQALMNLLHSNSTHTADDGIPSLTTQQENVPNTKPPSVIHRSRAAERRLYASRSPLLGYTASSMRCKTCFRGSPTKYTEFTSLSLTFPPTTSRVVFTLDNLLKYYFLSDSLSDVDCEDCSRRCGEPIKSDFLREQSLGKVPQCLCLHIQRLGWYGHHEAIKRHDRVVFPALLNLTEFTQLNKNLSNSSLKRGYTELVGISNNHWNQSETTAQMINQSSNPSQQINLSERVTNDNGESPHTPSNKLLCGGDELLAKLVTSRQHNRRWYSLVSVIEHSGTEVSGHFTTYRKVDDSRGRWIYTSDLDVRVVSAEYVHSRTPYMLFYERLPDQPS